jgi:hypothetical protein
MPGDATYQVRLPPTAAMPSAPGGAKAVPSDQPGYTALWHTIADEPDGVSPKITPEAPPAPPAPPPPRPVPRSRWLNGRTSTPSRGSSAASRGASWRSPTDDVADGEDVPHVGTLLLIHGNEPALVDLHGTPTASPPITFPLGSRPTATSTLSNTADSGALPPSKYTVSPLR